MNKILKFEVATFLISLLIVTIIRLIITLLDRQLLQDGNFLVLVIFPTLLLMIIFNILSMFKKRKRKP